MTATGIAHEERLLEDFGNRIRDVRTGPDGLIYLLLDENDASRLAAGAAVTGLSRPSWPVGDGLPGARFGVIFRMAPQRLEGRVMGHNTIRVTPVTPNIGGLVEGIDLTRPLDAPVVDDLHEALMEHQVLFFRGQELTHDTQKALGEHFGRLHISVGGDGTNSKQLRDYPEVRALHFDENSNSVSGNETWHTDQSCMETPPMGSILYIHTVPPAGGGDTMFASMYAAYEALSPAMKRYLEGMTAVHDGAGAFSNTATNQLPVTEQPMVARHPVTGRRLLYVNPGFTSHVCGVPKVRERRGPRLPLPPLRAPQFPRAVPLGAAFGGVLGQSLHAPLRGLGLPPAHAVGLPHPDQGRAPGGPRLARISRPCHGLRRARAFVPPGAGRRAYRAIRSRPATPRAGARARPFGRRCPADRVRRRACPMSPHRATRLSCPVGRTAPRRP